MSERTVQKANYLSADTVQALNDQHGWFQHADAQGDVSRAFANNAVHAFLETAIEAEQVKQETGMSPQGLLKHLSDMESRIVELEKENVSLKMDVERAHGILKATDAQKSESLAKTNT